MKHCTNQQRLNFLIKEYDKLFSKLNQLNNNKYMFLTKYDLNKFEKLEFNSLYRKSKEIDKDIEEIESEINMYVYEISKLRYCIETKTPWYWFL